jgi:hypothetical protein
MIHPLVKIITVDGFLSQEDGIRLSNITRGLQYVQKEFGQEIDQFNMVPEGANEMFSNILNTKIEVDEDLSGVFRKPELFIHFEGFDTLNEWVFVCALDQTMFNIYEHETGAKSALEGVNFNYRNLMEWGTNTKVSYELKPGEGVLFRPWLFHSFDGGLVQIFRLREKEE